MHDPLCKALARAELAEKQLAQLIADLKSGPHFVVYGESAMTEMDIQRIIFENEKEFRMSDIQREEMVMTISDRAEAAEAKLMEAEEHIRIKDAIISGQGDLIDAGINYKTKLREAEERIAVLERCLASEQYASSLLGEIVNAYDLGHLSEEKLKEAIDYKAKWSRLVERLRELIANRSESTIDLGHRRDYPLTQWVDTTKLIAAINESEANNDNT